jgi:hypothetical protein
VLFVESRAPEDVTQEADEADFDYLPRQPEPAAEMPQVSSLIAIIRIAAVLAMGLCVSFGLFLMLFGGKGLIIGGALVLLAVPCYFGMQFAERLALAQEQRARG